MSMPPMSLPALPAIAKHIFTEQSPQPLPWHHLVNPLLPLVRNHPPILMLAEDIDAALARATPHHPRNPMVDLDNLNNVATLNQMDLHLAIVNSGKHATRPALFYFSACTLL